MSVDLAILRLAFREADSMQDGAALVARKRIEFEQKLAEQRVAEEGGASGAGIDAALRDMERDADLDPRRPALPDDQGRIVDRLA